MLATDFVVFQILSFLPGQVVYYIASLVLFDIRSKMAFTALYGLCIIATPLISQLDASFLETLLTLAVIVGPQMICARDPLPRRTFIAVLFVIIILLGELFPSFIWLQYTDQSPSSPYAYYHMLDLVVMLRVFHIAVLSALFAGVFVAERSVSKTHTDQGITVFMGFFVVQCALLCLMMGAVELVGVGSRKTLITLFAATSLCVFADALLFVFMSLFNRSVLEDRRSAFLQREVDLVLERYRGIEREISMAATLRHDTANLANTIALLVRRGEIAHARSCLSELAERLEGECAPAEPESVAAVPVANDQPWSVGEAMPEGDAFEVSTAVRYKPKTMRRRKRYGLALLVLLASQLSLALILIGFAATEHPEPSFVLTLIAVLVICVMSDIVLVKGVSKAAERGFAEERSRLLAEQRHAHVRQNERLATELAQAQGIRKNALDSLRKLDGMLERGEVDDVLADMQKIISNIAPAGGTYCEHTVVNALVALKAEECAREGVSFTHDLVIPHDVGIANVDLCAAFSNILDNAIEANRHVEEGRYLSLKASVRAGALLIDAENACDHRGANLSVFGDLSLAREHGWGQLILSALADRYDGSFSAEKVSDSAYRASIMLLMPR